MIHGSADKCESQFATGVNCGRSDRKSYFTELSSHDSQGMTKCSRSDGTAGIPYLSALDAVVSGGSPTDVCYSETYSIVGIDIRKAIIDGYPLDSIIANDCDDGEIVSVITD